MRLPILALCAVLVAPAAQAGPSTVSTEIAENGLAATAARLAALPAPAAEDRFALGGVLFLRGVEEGLQLIWREALSDPTGTLPVLRLGDQDAPPTAVRDPGAVAALFAGLDGAMAKARGPLADLPAGADFGLEVRLGDLWFDIDDNGRRNPQESVTTLIGLAGAADAVVRFDRADAAWLLAYSHLIAGAANAVLAYDPTAAIAATGQARAQIDMLNGGRLDRDGFFDLSAFMDALHTVAVALDQTPDRQRLLAARDHMLAMVAANRRFWALVAEETDNDREWLPNDSQTAATDLRLPAGTGAAWLRVLDDAEAVLTGQKLLPHIQTEKEAGLNLARLIEDAPAIDLIGALQGADLLPYLERGPVVSDESWRRFEDIIGGNGLNFAVILN